MPIIIPDNIKHNRAEYAQTFFFSRLKIEVGLDNEEAAKISIWLADAYKMGWADGVNQCITLIKHIE